MKRRYRRFLRVISITLLILVCDSTVFSCGPYLAYDASMFLLFQRELPQDKALEPFCYAERFLHSYTADPANTDKYRNCAEWSAYTHSQATVKDIYNIQYNITPDQFLYAYRTGSWQSLMGNTFIQWLLKKENAAALQYFAFARKVEFEGSGEEDPWVEHTRPWYEDTAAPAHNTAYDSMVNIAMARCRSTTGFLKERYAFQAVKMIYYGGHYHPQGGNRPGTPGSTLSEVYETMLMDKPTVVADWGLVYYALWQDGAKAIYNMVKLFDRSNEKKVFAYLHLHKEQLDSLRNTTTDKKMLAAIAAISGFKNPGRALGHIQEVYNNDPTSTYLPSLVGREVNKLEDWLWSSEIKGFDSEVLMETDTNVNNQIGYLATQPSADYYRRKNKLKDESYLIQVRQSLISMLKPGNKNNDFLKLAIVHLYHMQRNYAAAAGYINTINVQASKEYTIQLNIEKALAAIYAKDITRPAVKQELNNIFVDMERTGITDTIPGISFWDGDDEKYKNPLRQLYLLLSHEYRKRRDIVTAGLLFQKAGVVVNEYYGGYDERKILVDTPQGDNGDGRYYYRIAYFEKFAAPADIDALLAFRHKQIYTAFENRLLPAVWASDDSYLDVKGTLLVRQEKYREALTVFNKIKPDFWATTYEFKYYLRKASVTSVSTLLPIVNGLGTKYEHESKAEICREIVLLQDSLAHTTGNNARAELCFMLGNSFYNISYYGKDWMATSYGKRSSEGYKRSDFAYYSFNSASNKQVYKNYYACARAAEMYDKAYKYAGKNNELAAQCLLMLAMCDKYAAYYNRTGEAISWYYDDKPYYSPFMVILARNFSNTDVFERSSTECPDVEEYLKKKNGIAK